MYAPELSDLRLRVCYRLNLRSPSPSKIDINELASLPARDPPSLPPHAFSSVIFLTPPKDDMEIHVSASLTMRSHKAIKRAKKPERRGPRSVSLSCLLIDDKENDWEVLDRQREFHLLSQIFRQETCAGILASHFSYCITLMKGLPGRSSEPSVTVMFCKRGGKKNNNTKTQKRTSFRDVSFLTVVSIVLS